MRSVTLGDRVRYAFDNFMARGTIALVLGLFAVSALVVLLVSGVVWLAGLATDQEGWDLPFILWSAMLRTLDPGTMGGDSGQLGFLAAMLTITFTGIFVISALIGIINTGLEAKLSDLRKGRSRVIESGHTVILGWSQQIFTVLSELVIANENKRRSSIVVMADRDKVEMEDEIRVRVPRRGRTRIVCRSGDPIDVGDLEIVGVQAARAIVILSPGVADSDAGVIKTILAITNNPNRRPEAYHIVAEFRDPANLAVAKMVGKDEAQLILVGDLVARIIAQTCRQSGLSVVYTELLDFDGDEIYMTAPPAELIGRPFGDALLVYEDSTVIGILADGETPRLNPPMDIPIRHGDQLIAISRDDDTIKPGSTSANGVLPDRIVTPIDRPRVPERTLILGWNWRGPAIVRELDAYVAPGSEILIVADLGDAEASLSGIRAGFTNETVEVRHGDTTDRALLDGLNPREFDHLIVLCYDVMEPQLADARTLITLLHLRDIASTLGHDFSIVSEMLDLRNRALAEVTRADDFIVSDRMISLLISQVAENRHLKAVFDDLFDPEGSEIYLRPAPEYIQTGQPLTFATVVEAARRRGEIAIGYRQKAFIEDASRAYGVVINPVKSAPITFESGDRVIVLAEDGFAAA